MNHGGTCIFQLFYLTLQVCTQIAVLSINYMDDRIFNMENQSTYVRMYVYLKIKISHSFATYYIAN